MSLGDLTYGLAVRAVRTVAPWVASSASKLGRGLEGRREAGARLTSWARRARSPDRPLAWFHAPSVGEGLQARAVIEALEERLPTLQMAFTHFSPSAEGLAGGMPVDVADYLPWDLSEEVRPVLEALRPSVLAFTKTEVWPILAREAARRGVRLALVAATLPEDAGRLRIPARWYLRSAFQRLEVVGAISHDDGERFHRALGVSRDRIVVTGDPGVDAAWLRARQADPRAAYLSPFHDEPSPTVVAGSTWPPDEAVLLPACDRLKGATPNLRLILAPHEPSLDRVTALETELTGRGWTPIRLGAVEERGSLGGADAVVVDRVGVLAQLYTVGTVSYVGGGFHSDGLHSVLEPAAAGLPVTFGPGHGNARAAADLLERGGAREVGNTGELADVLAAWLGNDTKLEEASARASGYIAEHRGAAGRTAELLEGFLARG